MFKLELYFLVNGEWKHIESSIRDRVPEKDDVVYNQTKSYKVVNIKEDDEDFYIFHVFLEIN